MTAVQQWADLQILILANVSEKGSKEDRRKVKYLGETQISLWEFWKSFLFLRRLFLKVCQKQTSSAEIIYLLYLWHHFLILFYFLFFFFKAAVDFKLQICISPTAERLYSSGVIVCRCISSTTSGYLSLA